MTTLRRFLSPLLILAMILGSLPVAAAPQGAGNELIGTQAALEAERSSDARERIHEVLARDDVRQQLDAQGVDPADIEARVAALSDAEAQQMADQLDEMPAGASVVGALFAVFVILLVTDILGLTNVFPFTR
ncbi:MAG: PA2779 family protein [Pseudomonadota bacterium]